MYVVSPLEIVEQFTFFGRHRQEGSINQEHVEGKTPPKFKFQIIRLNSGQTIDHDLNQFAYNCSARQYSSR